MRRLVSIYAICAFFFVFLCVGQADQFGAGDNQFIINFVDISNSTNPQPDIGIVKNNYRMGKYEITNDQWNKFKSNIGISVTGNPSSAYDANPYWTGANVPTNCVSWYEATQFVNWLNTSTGHQAAYKFTGTQGMSNYTFSSWKSGDTGYDAENPIRNSNAYYFLPTGNEWAKAAYWNGTSLQSYATVGDVVPVAGVDANYDFKIGHPWDVGSGLIELNGTYDMMGNIKEWMESSNPYNPDDESYSIRELRGGSYNYNVGLFGELKSYHSGSNYPDAEHILIGFRVASVPEPATMMLLAMGGLMIRRKKMRNLTERRGEDIIRA